MSGGVADLKFGHYEGKRPTGNERYTFCFAGCALTPYTRTTEGVDLPWLSVSS
jgi:hypothetical protein